MEVNHNRFRKTGRSFWIGFSFGWVAFVGAQFASSNIEYARFLADQEELRELGISFSVGGYSWGFPFKMYMNFWGFPNNVGLDIIPTVLNLVFGFAFAWILGIAFQFAWDAFRPTPTK